MKWKLTRFTFPCKFFSLSHAVFTFSLTLFRDESLRQENIKILKKKVDPLFFFIHFFYLMLGKCDMKFPSKSENLLCLTQLFLIAYLTSRILLKTKFTLGISKTHIETILWRIQIQLNSSTTIKTM